MSGYTLKDVVKEVKDKIFDGNFMKKYGTSVSLNMGLEYESGLNTNYKDLITEFSKFNKKPESILEKQEIVNFLTSIAKREKIDTVINIDDIYRLLDLEFDEDITT